MKILWTSTSESTLLTIFQARFCFGRAEGLASPRCISRAGCSSATSPTPEHGQNTLVAANCVFMEQNKRSRQDVRDLPL